MTGRWMETHPVQHCLAESALRLTVSVVPAQQFARQCCEADVELIFPHSTHAVVPKSAFPLTSAKHSHNHSWRGAAVVPPRAGTCCRQPSDLGLVPVYCHCLQPRKGGLNCASLSLGFKLHSDGNEFICRKPESIPCHCKQLVFAFIIYTAQEPTKPSFPATDSVLQQFSGPGIGRVWAIMSRYELKQQQTMLQHYHKVSKILQHRTA